MSAQTTHTLPPVIRRDHPEDGTAYTVTSGSTEYGREYILTDAQGVARRRSRHGAIYTVRHEHADGSSCQVATYRYGKEI